MMKILDTRIADPQVKRPGAEIPPKPYVLNGAISCGSYWKILSRRVSLSFESCACCGGVVFFPRRVVPE